MIDTIGDSLILIFFLCVVGVDLGPSEGWLIASSDISKDARIHTVKGLMPARDYQFRISAVNSVGEGKPSSASQTITLPQQRMYTLTS